MRRKLIPLAICGPLIALTVACTPQEIAQWQEWHSQDPEAAVAYAMQPEVQNELRASTPTQRRATPTTTTAPKPRSSNNTSSGVGRSGVNWDNVARCESGGQWHHPPVTNRYGTFSGGLMIMNSAWRNFGGTQFAPLAYQASREQQIIVAERIAARVGAARAWQCPV